MLFPPYKKTQPEKRPLPAGSAYFPTAATCLSKRQPVCSGLSGFPPQGSGNPFMYLAKKNLFKPLNKHTLGRFPVRLYRGPEKQGFLTVRPAPNLPRI